MRKILCLAVAGLSYGAIAQTTDSDSQLVEEIVTTTKRSEAAFDNPGNISAVSNKELKAISALHVQDTLAHVPGVSMQQGNGQESLPAVRSPVLTGAGACGAFLVAQDNIPLRAAGFCNVNELFEAYTEGANRIEVVRGPGSVLYGSNALHGIINVITQPAPTDRESQLGLEFGANDYRRENFSYGDRQGDQGFLVNLTATHDGGYRDESYYDQQKMQIRHETVVGDWTAATSLVATNLNQETAGYIEGFESYKDDDAIKQNLNPEAYRDVQSVRFYSRMEKALSESTTFSVTPYFRKSEMEFLQHFLPGTPLEENGQRSAGLQLSWYLNLSDAVSVITGIDSEFTSGYLKQTQENPTQGSAFLQATIPQGKHYDYEVDAVQWAGYANIDWQLSDLFTLNAGLRYENMSYDYDNKMIDGRTADDGTPCGFGGCRYSRPSDRSDDFDNVSATATGLFSLTDDAKLFVTIAQGYRAPQTSELYRLQNEQNVADIDSENVRSFEIGLRQRWDAAQLEVNLYQMDKENVIFQDNRIYYDGGESSHEGIEVDFRVKPSDLFDIALVANYGKHIYENNVISGIDVIDNYIDTAPKQFGLAQIGFNPADSIRVEAELQHVSKYFTDPANEHEYEGHDLVNLRFFWEASDTLNFAVRVLNALDENYAERADYTTFTQDRYFPGEPRSVYGAVNWRF